MKPGFVYKTGLEFKPRGPSPSELYQKMLGFE